MEALESAAVVIRNLSELIVEERMVITAVHMERYGESHCRL
jgi:hypothetical protein